MRLELDMGAHPHGLCVQKTVRHSSLEAGRAQGCQRRRRRRLENYVRGPQPALYRDPKTGATWSGRGRAPAWLADLRTGEKNI